MAPTHPPPGLSAIPPELIERVAEQATRDAHRVAGLLDAVGLAPSPGGVRHLPAEFLVELGAATRLLAWELDGLTLHREAGLPSAYDAVLRAFRDPDARMAEARAPDFGPSLSRAVFALTLGHLAWTGPAYLQAEVLLDTPDEDALVDSMARFLWERRQTPTSERGAMP